MHQFNSAQSASSRAKNFEPEHWPDDPFDGPVVLLDGLFKYLLWRILISPPVSLIRASIAAVLAPLLPIVTFRVVESLS
jgi:hypothetical protein